MDTENQKFCSTCGKESIQNPCTKCYCKNELDNKNTTPWINNPFWKQQHSGFQPVYICHHCKYFMYHPLFNCYTCPNRLVKEKYSLNELPEKLKEYREGW